ncbi:beta-glucan synthesis-associated protein [Thecaphora frezii]
MRTPACTCPGEDHPGPSVDVGRSAPELDVFEIYAGGGTGVASQSLQTAPFDAMHRWKNWDDASIIHHKLTTYNSYIGGPYQQSVSGTTIVPNNTFEKDGARPTRFGIDYEPDWNMDGSGHATWYVDGKPTWTLTGKAIGPQPAIEVGQRLVPVEPMSMVINLGISQGWGWVQWEKVRFPSVMKVDYVRVYQKDGRPDKISCDPPDHPTAKYIRDHSEIYLNPNHTVYPTDVYSWPRNRLTHNCETGERL